ncbi:hypothetical protein BDF20DRAFT_837576 [Mycotypha africana]|uniref:uncharacterized protein n=1 Tax=Mycotypha africana TaxID=64632 RepID=UPI002300EF73|nr:uncharacterized protein BDF20DRAFT_837576 [Mycotypha africana]KAI8973654.1 hypothetical protein BDF20DRAFT_837576 [Mycotypha africana]
MVMIQSFIAGALFFVVSGTLATNVATISNCPALTARATAAADVTDLRIDDIKVIGALGDSIMAGFGMMGVDYDGTGVLNTSFLTEYRGNSYGIGGDSGAVTLANFVKRYEPKVKGASVLSHLVSLCKSGNCSSALYRPLRDVFNAAQSGAVAMNLDFELDYLISNMKTVAGSTSFQNDWKMITIQIGSNDQCASCNSTIMDKVTATAYAQYVEAAIERIKNEIPKTVVNLIGTFKVSGVFPLSAGQSYCVPNGLLQNIGECSCSASNNWAKMDALSDAYNVQLQSIANKYKGTTGGTFAVMYSPAPIDLSSFPIDALSNIDCFHPSLKGHQWFAKTFWNQLFLPSDFKPSTYTFDANLGVYCPTDSDRLPTI